MKHQHFPTRTWLILAGMALASCASIVEGTDQAMTVQTEPSQASCTLSQDGSQIASISSTPGTITVDKSSKALVITCNRDGHFEEIASVTSSFEGMTFGNIIFGGIIGVGIDAASGAMHNYPNQMTLLLTPTSFGSEKARDDFFTGRREFLVSEAERATAKIRKNCLPDAKAECDDDVAELEQALSTKLAIVESQRASAKITVAAAAGTPNQVATQPVAAAPAASPETAPPIATAPAASPEPAPPVVTSATSDTPVQTAARPAATAPSPVTSPEPAPSVAPAAASLANSLSYWRLRDDILRKSISKSHLSTSSGGWSITKFRVVSAVRDDSDANLLILATAYTIERTNLADAGASRLRVPIRFERTLTVNDDTEEVVSVGTVKKVE